MLSRRVKIGAVLIAIGIMWMFGIVGGVESGSLTIAAALLKMAIGTVELMFGAHVMKGGRSNESDI